MTELARDQTDRLANSLVEYMLMDTGFMWSVARTHAETYTLEDYNEWFQEKETDFWEEKTG